MLKLNKKKGLTLIELLAVIAIIAILFVLLIPQVNSAINKARTSGVQTDFRSFQTAVQSHFLENNEGITSEEELNEHLDSALHFTNNVSKKTNPWGEPYVLSFTGDSVEITTSQKDTDAESYKLIYNNNEDNKLSFVGFDGKSESSTPTPTPEPAPVEHPDSNCSTRTITESDKNIFDYNVTDTGDGIQINDIDNFASYDSAPLVIPCEIDGLPVVALKDYTANSMKNITNKTAVVLPNTLKTIGDSFFKDSAIKSIHIPLSVTRIGIYAFNQSKLTSISIPSNVVEIDYYAFAGSKLQTAEIHGNPKIGLNAFNHIDTLTSVTLKGNPTYCDSAIEDGCSNSDASVALPTNLISN